MSEKRKRGQNFSLEDKDKLIKLIMQHKDTILNKNTDGKTNEAKLKAWNLVTDQFNSCSTSYRSKESLTKVWEKLKSEGKIYYTLNRRPRISKTNERSKALTGLYASSKEVNKKKELIEDLKLKLLEDEIEYKNKWQDIQLKLAMKELEIKSTVLEQLRAARS